VTPGRNFAKVVTYGIVLVPEHEAGRELVVQVREVHAARWCSWEEAMAVLAFEETRGVLRRARGLVPGLAGEERREVARGKEE